MNVLFYTLGCKLNQAETEALGTAFLKTGCRVTQRQEVDNGLKPDLIIINSCTVTARSEQKARLKVRSLSRQYPHSLLLLTGCYVQLERDNLKKIFHSVDGLRLINQDAKDLLLRLPEALKAEPLFSSWEASQKASFFDRWFASQQALHQFEPFAFNSSLGVWHSRAFLKIQDGCDRCCAYCRVPLARGPSLSLSLTRVKQVVAEIEANGFKEVVLTGVNISSYRDGSDGLVELLATCLAATNDLRFRLSSLEPDGINDRLLEVLKNPRICPHFHLPLQSGSTTVLARMGRNYQADDLRECLQRLKTVRPEAFISGDVIVGFPGETDEEFEETLELVAEVGLNGLHVFPFSPRPGTKAFAMSGRVSPEICRKRAGLLLQVMRKHKREFLDGLMGKTVEVILEVPKSNGLFLGTTEYSLKCLVEGLPPYLNRAKLKVKAKVTAVQAANLRAAFLSSSKG